MTSTNGQGTGVQSSAPVVRAPRAAQPSDDSEWARLAQRALGLGAPGLRSNGHPAGPDAIEPADDAVPAVTEAAPAVAARVNGSSATTPGRSRPARPHAELPSSPADHDGMYRGLLWVAWAIEECSRAFTRVSSRLASVEKRLDTLEAVEAAAPSPTPTLAPVVDGELERLEARLDQLQAEASARVDTLEERLRQLDFIPLKLTNLQRAVDQLATAQPGTTAARMERPERSVAADLQIRELRRDLAAAQRHLATLEAKALDDDRVAVLVDEAVHRHAERLAGQAPAASDLEGVYRELDAVAEFVAARSAATADGLERIAPLEAAVLELRRDLGRGANDRTGGTDMGLGDDRLDELETRLRKLELSSRKASRLFSALASAVQVRHPSDASFNPVDPARHSA